MLHGADVAHTLSELDTYGFSSASVQFDISKLVSFSRGVSERLSGGVAYLMKKNSVDVISGAAKLVDKGVVSVVRTDVSSRPRGHCNRCPAAFDSPALPPTVIGCGPTSTRSSRRNCRSRCS